MHSVTRKKSPTVYKVVWNDFTRKMIDFDTFTKIAQSAINRPFWSNYSCTKTLSPTCTLCTLYTYSPGFLSPVCLSLSSLVCLNLFSLLAYLSIYLRLLSLSLLSFISIFILLTQCWHDNSSTPQLVFSQKILQNAKCQKLTVSKIGLSFLLQKLINEFLFFLQGRYLPTNLIEAKSVQAEECVRLSKQ